MIITNMTPETKRLLQNSKETSDQEKYPWKSTEEIKKIKEEITKNYNARKEEATVLSQHNARMAAKYAKNKIVS